MGWVDVFMNYTAGATSCQLSMTELQAMCETNPGGAAECLAFGNYTADSPSSCQPVYLGDGISFANVFTWDDATQTCEIDMGELAQTCVSYPTQCTTFLEADQCQPVWLGFDSSGNERVPGGYGEVFEWNPITGSCVLDTAQVAALCGADSAACIALIDVAGCSPGWYDHDGDMTTGCMPCNPGQFSPARATECTDCRADWADRDRNPATPCQRCANGFQSSPGSVQCESALSFCPAAVYLGPTVGYQDIRSFTAGSCAVDSTLFDAYCGPAAAAPAVDAALRQECIAFLGADNQCPPVYLGATIGWAAVTSYDGVSGQCLIDSQALGNLCNQQPGDCAQYLNAGSRATLDCDPVYAGPNTGWANVFARDALGQCVADQAMLSASCGNFYDECMAYLQGGSAPTQSCEPLWLGASGWANVFDYDPSDGLCKLNAASMAAACAGNEAECNAILVAGRR